MMSEEQMDLVTVEESVEGMDGKPVSLAGLASAYSGKYIAERNPKLARLIQEAVKYGVPISAIHEATGIHESAIAQVAREGEQLSLEDSKRVLVRGLGQMQLGIVRLFNEWLDAGKLKPEQAQAMMVAFGIATEKKELLSGGPTHRVEHGVSPERQALRERLLGSAGVPPMVLQGGKLAQMREAAPARAADLVIEAETVTRDSETLDSMS